MIQAPHTPSPLSVQAFFDEATSTVTYLLADPDTGAAAIIDPVLDFDPRSARLSTTSADRVLAAIAAEALTLTWILETHAHADHLSAAHHLRKLTGAQIAIGRQITEVQKGFGNLFEAEDIAPDGGDFDLLVAEGDQIALGHRVIRIMQTPGHTPACVSYLIEDCAFVGDTLFMPDYGTARADFPGGDAATLYRSIHKILALPPQTRIFVGHDYLPAGRQAFAWETTVGEQRAANVHVHDGVKEADFVTMRKARDATLPAPTLILPALQVNIRAGALPPASASGRVFLKLPINAI
ncbi:MBL fold metallo-hydrolase [Caulobacter henricii]|uniref:MBL fold metallo-hydrolase n=1 Tax=Caulobacter henricii TaxID=69395 RepID=A0A0N7JH58_9CAUL|nr:MBL fold metallo-hydrolase [Caulobacter henricii]ALL12474.1 MBL fold metallo-hydrolase [Caulobacter henricii]